MRYPWVTILSMMAVPVAIFLGLEVHRNLSSTDGLYFEGWWKPVGVALLAVWLVHSLLRLAGNRGNRDRGRHQIK